MLVHLLVNFTTIDEARADLRATHGTSVTGVVLCTDGLGPEALGALVPEVADGWMTPVSVLADRAVVIDTSERRGWSFARDPEDGMGVVTAFDAAEAARLAAAPGDDEIAVVLRPDEVSFDALAGVVDHLILDAQDPDSGRVDRRAVSRVAREATRRGRSRADTRRWRALGDVATLAPLGDRLQDPSLEVPEGWAVGQRDLVPMRHTSEAQLGRRGWYYAQPRVGNPYDDAPLIEGNGGILYIEDLADKDRFEAALAALRAPTLPPYAAFLHFATDVAEQRFLSELRIFAGESLCGVLGWSDDHPQVERSVPISDLLAAFARIAPEDTRAYGALGEDGDDAYARVGFGLWTENAARSVLRFWSRPYLILK